jgi:hypothetical protein
MSKYKSKIKVNYPTLATTARMGHLPSTHPVARIRDKGGASPVSWVGKNEPARHPLRLMVLGGGWLGFTGFRFS